MSIRAQSHSRSTTPLFVVFIALSVPLSAFLLFSVQPMMAKSLLPQFGGSAAVWTTSMLFFQAMLLVGYAYVDALTRYVPLGRQAPIHMAVIGGVLLVQVFSGTIVERIEASSAVNGIGPAVSILVLLAFTIGLPYFGLSTTGPLLQSWFHQRRPERFAYRLYALSNIGSLGALLSYPVLFETRLSNTEQHSYWGIGYFTFSVAVAATASILLYELSKGVVSARREAAPATAKNAEQISRGMQLRWLLYSATGSALLLAFTAHITENIAAVPMLWVVPLALYLATFILCFDSTRWYRKNIFRTISIFVPLLLFLGTMFHVTADGAIMPGAVPVAQAIPAYCVGLFILCMFCHGELEAVKPESGASRFYLMLAIGGVAGGIFVAVVAPTLFRARWEMPVSLAIVTILAASHFTGWRLKLSAVCLGSLVAISMAQIYYRDFKAVSASRNFYGAIRTTDVAAANGDTLRQMFHGSTAHGSQLLNNPGVPTAYYSTESGVGRAITAMRESKRMPLDIGVIGLGAGTIAAYGLPGDKISFFELDDQVHKAATEHFTYLRDSKASVRVVIGDGRMLLQAETSAKFDLLVIDAFSGSSIPIHLLTSEALELYRSRVAANGAIALHLTNTYVDLRPIPAWFAAQRNLHQMHLAHEPRPEDAHFASPSSWSLVTASQSLTGNPGLRQVLRPYKVPVNFRGWTDSFSNVFDRLR